MGSEEDPRDYDTAQKHFKIGFVIAGVSGTLMWILMFFWVFYYNGGLTWGTNVKSEINLHIVLMIFFVIYLQGHGINTKYSNYSTIPLRSIIICMGV